MPKRQQQPRQNSSEAQLRKLLRRLSVKSKKSPFKRVQGKARAPLPRGMPSVVDHYATALCHPFEREAIGARIPEPFACPTTTYKLHVPLVVNTDSAGSWDAVIVPHVLNTVYSTFASTSSTTGITGGATLNFPISQEATYNSTTAQSYMNAACSAANLASKFKNYRIVSWGVRLKTNMDFTKSGGRIYWARVAAPSQVPLGLSTGSNAGVHAACFEVPLDSSGHMTSQIIDMPEAGQLQVSQLLGPAGHEWTFHPVSGNSNQFIDAANLTFEQGLITSNGLGTTSTPQTFSTTYASTAGLQALWIKGEGCTTATLAPGAFSLEIIFHVEGTQNILAGSSEPALLASAAPPALASPEAAFRAVRAAMSLPPSMPVAAKAEAFAKKEAGVLWNKAKGALASKAGSAGLSAAKALGLAML